MGNERYGNTNDYHELGPGTDIGLGKAEGNGLRRYYQVAGHIFD
jgi:hypothetical protein